MEKKENPNKPGPSGTSKKATKKPTSKGVQKQNVDILNTKARIKKNKNLHKRIAASTYKLNESESEQNEATYYPFWKSSSSGSLHCTTPKSSLTSGISTSESAISPETPKSTKKILQQRLEHVVRNIFNTSTKDKQDASLEQKSTSPDKSMSGVRNPLKKSSEHSEADVAPNLHIVKKKSKLSKKSKK